MLVVVVVVAFISMTDLLGAVMAVVATAVVTLGWDAYLLRMAWPWLGSPFLTCSFAHYF